MPSEDDDDTAPPTFAERPAASRIAATRITSERYRLGELIGKGGMGEVVSARDDQIGREVAIKRIRHEAPSEQMVKRFEREARIQGRLEHPAIPPVHELGRDAAGRPFIVMKKLAGRTLSSLLRDRPEGSMRKRLLRGFVDVCLAVEFAHVNGVIHRDLKPDNIVLGDFGEVYVLDWGVAKLVGDDDSFDDIRSDELLTRTGTAIGTTGYMAPEQAAGQPDVDERADVYALGRVLERILGDDAAPELSSLAARATADDRARRLPTARALADGVQRFLDGDRDLEQRRRLADEHLARARAAYAIEDAGQRALAMREAGRALALDPTQAGAGELIGRLMLEPPKVLPPEVVADVEADARSRVSAQMRSSLWGMLGYLVLIPGLVMASSWPLAIAALLAAVIAVAGTYYMSSHPSWPTWTAALFNGPMIAVIACMYSPLLFAPGVGAVLAMTIGTSATVRGARAWLAVWLVIATMVLAPLIGELAGILPRTFTAAGDGLHFHAPAVGRGSLALMLATSYAVTILGFAVALSYLLRRGEVGLRREVFLQAWQLRQLAPDPQRG